MLTLENCALTYLDNRSATNAQVTVTLDRPGLSPLLWRHVTLADAIGRGMIILAGDASKLRELFELIDECRFLCEILEPRRAW